MKIIGYFSVFLLLFSLVCDAKSGSFQLQVSQGYRFDTGETTKSGGNSDLSFTYQVRRAGIISYLQATHIKRFDARPDAAALKDIASWAGYVAAPSPGYYVLEGHTPGRYYLLKLDKFENQGKAASYWLMTFSWEEMAR